MYPIATATLATAGTATFFSIPQNFTHLQLRCFYRSSSTTAADGSIYFNGDYTAGDYAYGSHNLSGDGASASSYSLGNTFNGLGIGKMAYAGATSTGWSVAIIDILDYTNTNKYKTAKSISGWDNNGSGNVNLSSGVWLNTAAITQISIQNFTSPYSNVAGSTFQLYGITTA